jgi:DNA-binding transcriptional MocR family regulator
LSEVEAPLGASLVRERVVERLRHQILSGVLAPGQRLNEIAIANEYGISRGPAREASQRLASEGLVRVMERRGAFVVSISADELRELYEVRSGLESFGARLAAKRAEPEATRRLLDELATAGQQLGRVESTGYPLDRDYTLRSRCGTACAKRDDVTAQRSQARAPELLVARGCPTSSWGSHTIGRPPKPRRRVECHAGLR